MGRIWQMENNIMLCVYVYLRRARIVFVTRENKLVINQIINVNWMCCTYTVSVLQTMLIGLRSLDYMYMQFCM